MENRIDELNKLEEQISQTQQLLKQTDKKDSLISSLKTQRNIFAILTLLLLASSIYFFFNKTKSSADDYIENNNAILIEKDSLMIYKKAYLKNLIAEQKKSAQTNSLINEKIIYSVQIGAFKDFNLTSDGLLNLSEYQANGFNKFS